MSITSSVYTIVSSRLKLIICFLGDDDLDAEPARERDAERDLERDLERDIEAEELGKLRTAGRGVASRSIGVSARSNRRFFGVDVILSGSVLIELDGGLARQLLDAILRFLLRSRIAPKGRELSCFLASARLVDAILGL